MISVKDIPCGKSLDECVNRVFLCSQFPMSLS